MIVDEPDGGDRDARVHEIGVAVARRRGDLAVGECGNNPSRQAPKNKETNRKEERERKKMRKKERE